MIEKYIDDFKDYLVDGHYIYDSGSKVLKLIGKDDLLTFSKQFSKKNNLNKDFFIESSSKLFCGNTLLITSNDYGVKIFSDNEVLTYFYDNRIMESLLKNHDLISKIFKVNSIKRKNEHFFVEKKLNNSFFDKEAALSYVFSSYIDFYNQNKLDNTKHLKTLQHCDLWSGNLIFDKEFYLIDFESVAEDYFLYDILFYIYSELYINGDKTLLVNYFSGYYDGYLNNLFNSLGLYYNRKKRVHYFNIFAKSFLRNKFYTFSLFRKIKQFIKIHMNKFIALYYAKKGRLLHYEK